MTNIDKLTTAREKKLKKNRKRIVIHVSVSVDRGHLYRILIAEENGHVRLIIFLGLVRAALLFISTS
jgi:hypothetical protein